MGTTTDALGSGLKIQNDRIAYEGLKVKDQATSGTAPSDVQSEGLYLAFVTLKDIEEGHGEKPDFPGHCMYMCKPKPPEHCMYMCGDPINPWKPDKPDKPDKPEKPEKPRPEKPGKK